jgi:hypothetical protein
MYQKPERFLYTRPPLLVLSSSYLGGVSDLDLMQHYVVRGIPNSSVNYSTYISRITIGSYYIINPLQ